MVERPIIFAATMVNAIIRPINPKTQTRRDCFDYAEPYPTFMGIEKDGAALFVKSCFYEKRKLRWAVGDKLWVRETWAVDAPLEQVRREHEDMMAGIGHGPYYRADPVHKNAGLRWRSPIHMPRWASRVTLDVIDVRVERLMSISKEDVIAEGITERHGRPIEDCVAGWHEPYAELWDRINGAGSWDTNPWIAALTFRRVPNV